MSARAALFTGALAAAATLFFAVPAGASPGVGRVTVSNPSPTRTSAIEVTSTGWQPGGAVSIALSGTGGVLGHAMADAEGVVHTHVSIPADAAPGNAALLVVGSAAGGVPQQIVTNLAVMGSRDAPAPARPWTAVYLLLAIATAFLLASVRSERVSERRLAVVN